MSFTSNYNQWSSLKEQPDLEEASSAVQADTAAGAGHYALEFLAVTASHKEQAQASAADVTGAKVDLAAVDSKVPLAVIEAKRLQVQQKLEALLGLQSSPDTPTPGASTNLGTGQGQTPATDELMKRNGSFHRVDSSDWLAFADIMGAPALTPSAPTSSTIAGGSTMPPLPVPSISAAPRVVSSNCLSYVYSERLADILPDLAMDNSPDNAIDMPVPDEEDHIGLLQFFTDSDAWLKPAQVSSSPMVVVSDADNSDADSSTGTTTKDPRKKRASKKSIKGKLGRPSAFPQKLYKMLTAIDQHDSHLSGIVAFVDEGSAFQIHDNEAFVETILPQYFKMSSFSSFQRQLQLYSFKRVTKGGAYRHPLFHRDTPDNLNKMARKQSKPSNFVLTLAEKSA